MWEGFRALISKGLPTIFAVSGIVAIFLSFIEFESVLNNKTIRVTDSPIIPRLIVGLAFLIFGVVIYWWENLSGSWIGRNRVLKSDRGFVTSVERAGKHTQIEIVFGRIEDVPLDGAAAVLPINEFFEDRCLSDPRASLGAFSLKHFQGAEHQLLIEELHNSLRKISPLSSDNQDEGLPLTPRFAVGTCIIIERPAQRSIPMIIAVTSTKRSGGIRSEISFLFAAITQIHEMMANNEIDSIVIPLIGTGKGGLRPEIALFSMIIAFSEAICRPTGHHIKNIQIIVFQNENGTPEIRPIRARRILGIGTGMFNR